MKIMLLTYGLTHYYTKVLNKLNMLDGVDIVVITPEKKSSYVGAGVLLSDEGKNFKVIALTETKTLKIFYSFKGLSQAIRKEKPDIIITLETFLYSLFLFPSLLFALKSNNTKVILKSIPFQIPTYQEAKENIKKANLPGKLPKLAILILRQLFYRKVHAHLDYIDEAIPFFGGYGVPKEKIFVMRNSPDTDLLFEIRKRIDAEPQYLPPCPLRLIHVGRLVEWKNVDLLINAFAQVKKTIAKAKLLIIGSGPKENELQELANSLNLSESIQFLGDVHDPYMLGRYLRGSTIYVLAGMGGLSINDAMCFGLPIICSIGDGTEKVLVRDNYNGRYFKEQNREDLVAKILEIGLNPEIAKKMGDRSTEIIKNEVNIHTVLQGYLDAFKYVTT